MENPVQFQIDTSPGADQDPTTSRLPDETASDSADLPSDPRASRAAPASTRAETKVASPAAADRRRTAERSGTEQVLTALESREAVSRV